MAFEILEGNGGDQFKFRRLVGHGIGKGTDIGGDFRQFSVGNGLSVHAHSLIEKTDIGGGVKSHPIACRPKDGGQHRAGGALSVGTRHVNESQSVLGIAQRLTKSSDPFQSRLAEGPADGMNILQGFLIVHVLLFPLTVWC